MKTPCIHCFGYLLIKQRNPKFSYCPSCGYTRKTYIMSISKDELLKGRDKKYASEYTQEISDNLDRLLIPMNKIREVYAKPMIISSGWRPAEVNAKTPGAAKQSKHMIGLAVDIVDADGNLRKWVLRNLQLMKELGIYLENFNWTKGWVHFQLGAPHSGKRIFVPSPTPPEQTVWDGKYSEEFDS